MPFRKSLRPTPLDHDVATIGVAQLAQSLPEAVPGRGVLVAKHSNPVDLR